MNENKISIWSLNVIGHSISRIESDGPERFGNSHTKTQTLHVMDDTSRVQTTQTKVII